MPPVAGMCFASLMEFLDRLFANKRPAAAVPAPGPTPAPVDEDGDGEGDDVELAAAPAGAVQGPREFVRAAALQRAYWTHDAAERAARDSLTAIV